MLRKYGGTILGTTCLAVTFGMGFGLGWHEHTPPKSAPICIVVHANGAPAPSSCDNPNSYQVNN